MKTKDQLSLFETEPEPELVIKGFEYFFLVSPPYPIRKTVKEFRNKLDHQSGINTNSLHSAPHITLIRFNSSRTMNHAIIRRTKEILSELESFTIHLKGAAKFEHGHTNTLKLEIRSDEAIGNLFKVLRNEFCPWNKNSFDPYLTIAGSIPNKKFDRISLMEYDMRTSFLCETITLMVREYCISRSGYKKSKYRTVSEFILSDPKNSL